MKAPKLTCTPKALPKSRWVEAARAARDINPMNYPPVERMAGLMRGLAPSPLQIAVLTTKYWGPKGVKLAVGFMDSPPRDLRARILQHMNAWGAFANVSFAESRSEPQVRIARESGRDGGYWSYVGTDIRQIPAHEQTMNLEGFTMETPESEFIRVVRHETGHTLGFPHEHMRRDLVAKIDRRKAIEFFMRTQGWTEREVIQQVLTPLEESSLIGTSKSDPRSIMCYQIPGFLTKDGKPILGGRDISPLDAEFVATIYPMPKPPTGSKRKPGTKPSTKRRRRRGSDKTTGRKTARKGSRKTARKAGGKTARKTARKTAGRARR